MRDLNEMEKSLNKIKKSFSAMEKIINKLNRAFKDFFEVFCDKTEEL